MYGLEEDFHIFRNHPTIWGKKAKISEDFQQTINEYAFSWYLYVIGRPQLDKTSAPKSKNSSKKLLIDSIRVTMLNKSLYYIDILDSPFSGVKRSVFFFINSPGVG